MGPGFDSPQLHHSKAAGNGGFSFIPNGFRLFTFITNMTEITSFFKKCCQNVVRTLSGIRPRDKEKWPPSFVRKKGA